ncbi:hypothetical protein ACTMU2_16370 [Cupriavidus basilensis]
MERLEAVLSKTGQVQSWLHRSAAPTIASLFTEGAKGQQLFGVRHVGHQHALPHSERPG